MNPAVARFYWKHMPYAQHVLDLGCATGDLGKYKPQDVTIYGIDQNPRLLKQAEAYYEQVYAFDLDQQVPLPFSDNAFDAVVAKDILEHVQKPWKMLQEIHRIVKPGGAVMASVPCERSKRVWNDYTHIRGFTRQALRQMFEDSGFHVVNIWKMGGVPGTSRLNLIWFVPILLRFPVFDWLWTSSYEIKALRP